MWRGRVERLSARAMGAVRAARNGGGGRKKGSSIVGAVRRSIYCSAGGVVECSLEGSLEGSRHGDEANRGSRGSS